MSKQKIRDKIKVIDGAIEHCTDLLNNKTIKLNGVRKIVIDRGSSTDEQIKTAIYDLMTERVKLHDKLNNF